FELSAVEVDVLLFMANNPELNTSAEFIRLRKIAKSHVSLAVNTLFEKGYITKIEDEKNRKKIHLIPAEAAGEIVEYGRAEQKSFVSVVNRCISEEEKVLLRETMKRISENLNQEYTKKLKDGKKV
ncbi:MAG: helix-turn-helix domain-containing protein, partial [Bacteroidales bacterium]|nr:helix-turn-helix domain-containing protein [Bacteroidales bacterium]